MTSSAGILTLPIPAVRMNCSTTRLFSPWSPSSSLFPSAQVLSSTLSAPTIHPTSGGLWAWGCCTIHHRRGGGRLGVAVSTRSTPASECSQQWGTGAGSRLHPPLDPSRCHCRRSTCDPPHERWLVRVVAGSASSVAVVGWCVVSHRSWCPPSFPQLS